MESKKRDADVQITPENIEEISQSNQDRWHPANPEELSNRRFVLNFLVTDKRYLTCRIVKVVSNIESGSLTEDSADPLASNPFTALSFPIPTSTGTNVVTPTLQGWFLKSLIDFIIFIRIRFWFLFKYESI